MKLFTIVRFFPGNHYDKVKNLFDTIGFGILSKASYHRLAAHVIQPIINDTFNQVIKENIEISQTNSPGGLVVAGELPHQH